MKLVIFTIVYNGMPFVTWQYPIFQRLKCDWKWFVVDGACSNQDSTKWCRDQVNQSSNDGTLSYLQSIRDKRVSVYHGTAWRSKDHMVAHAVDRIVNPCVLMQIDADEIHTPENIDRIVLLFEDDPQLGAIRIPCRFFVGKNLVCVGEDCWSNRRSEWQRAWRFKPGMKFMSHEPPVIEPMERRITVYYPELRFDHYAYALRKQVEYKEQFYGYKGLTNQWTALQKCDVFPQQLNRFFDFKGMDDRVIVDRQK